MMNEDGTAHFAYYDPDTKISYVWNGADKIEVCPGGYGEPVHALIPAPMIGSIAMRVLLEFKKFIESDQNPFLDGVL